MKKILVLFALLSLLSCASNPERAGVPQYKVDPFWPKPLPENWMLGQVAAVAVDRQDNVWVLHRPTSLLDDEKGAQKNPPETKCCVAAPAVLQFDSAGNLLRSWGGKGAGYDWFESEHGIFVDDAGNVWVGGNSPKDHHVVKFTPDGKFIKQLGKPGASLGSNSTTQLGRPAQIQVDAAANELYVADGYGNRRIIVFDATTFAYKRHWGAYGEKPHDDKIPAYDPKQPLMRSFQNPVHCVRLSNDGLVYVCDRQNDRVQVFEKSGKYLREFQFEPETLQNGSVWDLVFTEDRAQKYMIIANGASGHLIVAERETGKVVSTFSRPGRMAGELRWVHSLAVDSKGNIYTAEVGFGRRAQKFLAAVGMFSGKVLAITGASDGIGAEIARQASGKGVWLALAARNLEKLEAVAADCRSRGAEALAIRCDVGAEVDCRHFIEETVRKYSSLDILVNNAGVSGHARFEEVTDFGWYEDMMRVNYMGSLYCSRYALPHLKKSRGQIVAISSLAGKVGVPGRTAYSPSKAAQAFFFEALRLEVQESGVDITIVYPGVVATDIRVHGYGPDGKPAGKSGLKEDKAMAVDECARQIIAATLARKRELVMTLQARIGMWLKLAFPKMVDRMILKAVKKD